jgi:hypothetical protein
VNVVYNIHRCSASSTASAPVASNATSSLVSTASVITAGAGPAPPPSVVGSGPGLTTNAAQPAASNASITNKYGIVWSKAGWITNINTQPIFLTGEKEQIKAGELFGACELPLPLWSVVEKVEFEPFDGTKANFHKFSEAVRSKASANDFVYYLNTPMHVAIKRVLTLLTKAHMLTKDVGGAIDPNGALGAALTAPVVVTHMLARYINSVVKHVRMIYNAVFTGLMKAISAEENVTKRVQMLQQKHAAQFADGLLLSSIERGDGTLADDESMGSTADAHALWVMLHHNYQLNRETHVNELKEAVDATVCQADTYVAVDAFFTRLNTLQQELAIINGVTDKQKEVHLAMVEWRRRQGLTPMLLRELKMNENLTGKVYEGAALEKWARSMIEIQMGRGGDEPAPAISAVQNNSTAGKANTKHCEYCHQRGHAKFTTKHDTAHHIGLPTGWKKGDPIVESKREGGKKSARPTYNQLINMVTALQVEINSNKTSSSSYSSSHLPATRTWNGYVASLTEEVKYDMPVYEMKVACVSAPDVSSMNGDGVDLNIDRKALLDSGSAPMLAPNSKLAKGAVRKMDFVTKLTMADRSASMYATECMTMTLGKDLYIENVLIVPAMKNIIISETKLREQMLSAVCLNGWATRNIVRVLNGKEAAAGEKARYEAKSLATFTKTGDPGEAGLYWLTIDEAHIEHNNEAKNLSNGEIFNIAYGERVFQEEQLTREKRKQRADKAAREAANPPAVPGKIPKKALTPEQRQAAARKEIQQKRAESASSSSSSSTSSALPASSSSAVAEDSEDDMYESQYDDSEDEE